LNVLSFKFNDHNVILIHSDAKREMEFRASITQILRDTEYHSKKVIISSFVHDLLTDSLTRVSM
jgi:hypothetical protein